MEAQHETPVDPTVPDHANLFGERLREQCFVGEGYGCYEDFDLGPEFERIQSDEIRSLLLNCFVDFESAEFTPEGDDRVHIYSDGTITVGWFWDGDGALFFERNGCRVLNDDCKKDYTWDWI